MADSGFLSSPLIIVASDALLEAGWLPQGEEDLRRLVQRHIVQSMTQQLHMSSPPTTTAAHTQTGNLVKGLSTGCDGVVGLLVDVTLGVGVLLEESVAGTGAVVLLVVAGRIGVSVAPITGRELGVGAALNVGTTPREVGMSKAD